MCVFVVIDVRRKLAVVDANSKVYVYNLDTKELLYEEVRYMYIMRMIMRVGDDDYSFE